VYLGGYLSQGLTNPQLIDNPEGGLFLVGTSLTSSTAGVNLQRLFNEKAGFSVLGLQMKVARGGHVAAFVPDSAVTCA
jgi:hypothetical protein